MTLYGLKNCDSCRAALKALRAGGQEVRFVDLRDPGLSEAERARFLAAFGDALINRRSTTWRGLDAGARQAEPDALLAAHPTLMKRPVIEDGAALYLGWTAEVRAALLG